MKLKYQAKAFFNAMKRRLWANNSAFVRFYYKRIWNPKEGTLSSFLDDFAKSQEDVFFIQVGSNDGIQHDPLSKFIKRDAWSGIMIEPQKVAFKLLSYAYQSENITTLNIAINNQNMLKRLYKLSFSDDRWASGISSFLEEQVTAQIDNGHVGRVCEKYGITPPIEKSDYITFEEVECLTFSTLFQKYDVKEVDLLHIDTEGFDFEIIKLFDFDRFQPKVVAYEHTHLSASDRAACQLYLEQQSYTIHIFDADTVGVLSK